ncbi:MAG: hypothetical protein F4069_03755 [Rhodothermaceae bacterium]|nr:hypothetical protein [Rhodothermaceae bacterium]MYG70294.1 hypothetical protein [Rhodothermaceae bacterium]MYJ44430.1 hypothetical protein [Rhodothermaceae bacterium]
MSTRVKSLVVLGCTLIIGIAIGILGASTWQHRRNVALSETRIQGGLTRHIERVIDFQDEEQLAEVRTIVRRAERSLMQQRRRAIDSLAVHRQILIADLQQVLTSEQWQRLEAWLDREQKHRRDRRDRSSSQRRSSRKNSSDQKPQH